MIRALFSESSDISMMRVQSFLLVLNGIGITIWGMAGNKPLTEVSILAGTVLGIAVGGKAAQKFAEIKK